MLIEWFGGNKMRIMVFDVPAESGGALSILNEYYDNAANHKDKNIEWIFVVSKPDLKPTDNVKVLRYPWIKKSWIHRLYFDYFVAPKLVYKYDVDEILSLQNLIIPKVKNTRQSLYVHQSLPFVDYKINFKENKKLWIYQNIIGRKIVNSIKKADHVIVQTNWMKKICIEKTGIEANRIEVRPPEVNIQVKEYFNNTNESMRTFFYPAGGSYYKNHRIIVEACEKLIEDGIDDFNVIFTLKGDENKHIKYLNERVKRKELPIDFIGRINREEVFKYYTKSILIFPSYIETFGLPLLEAKLHNGIILASNCHFSREALKDYPRVEFFNPFEVDELAKLMKDKIFRVWRKANDQKPLI